MKKIAVFKRPDRSAELTQIERELMMTKLRDTTKIDPYHFSSFIEGEAAAAAESPVTTNVPAVLLRKVIDALRPSVITAAPGPAAMEIAMPTAMEIAMPFPMPAMNSDMTESYMIAANKPVHVIGISLRPTAAGPAPPAPAAYMTFEERVAEGIYDQRTLELSPAAMADFELIAILPPGAAIAALRLLMLYAAYRRAARPGGLYLLAAAPPIGPAAAKRLAPRGIAADATPQTAMAKAFAGTYIGRLSGSKPAMIADIIAGRLWDAYVLMRTGDPRAAAALTAEKEYQRAHRNVRAYERTWAAAAADIAQTQHYARTLFNKSAADATAAEHKIIAATKAAARRPPQKCEHTPLVRRGAWDELKRILATPDPDPGMIKCTICDRPAICSHTRDAIEFGRDDPSGLRAMLMKKYVSAAPTDDAYFCIVCGEKLAARFHERAMPGAAAAAEPSPLGHQIWKETIRTIAEHIIFTTLFDTRAMAASIADTVQPFIEADLAAIRTVRMNSDETIKNVTYLYTSLYVFAALVHIVALHAADMRFKPGPRRAGAGPPGPPGAGPPGPPGAGPPLKLLQQLFGEALNIIVRTKTSVIERLPNIDIHNIKSIFVSAYTNVSKLYIRTETIAAAPPESIVGDAVYQYLFRAMRKSAPTLRIGDTRRIFGIDSAAGGSIYDNIETPPDWPAAAAEPRIGTGAEFEKKYHEYAYASLIHMLKYVKHGIFRLSPETAKHAADYAKIRAAEIAIYAVLRRYHDTSFGHTRSAAQYGAFHFVPTRVSAIYCASGTKHVFTTHMYEQGLIRADVPRGKMDKWPPAATYIGAKCAKCGATTADAGPAADATAAAAIRAKDKLVAFYTTYTYKCPNGGLHAFGPAAAAPCTKCGITRVMIQNLDPPPPTAAPAPPAPAPAPAAPPRPAPPRPAAATPPDLPIADIARVSRTPPEIIAAFGALDGTIAPDHGGLWIHRAAIMIAHMTSFIIEYELFRSGNERSQFHTKWGTAAAALPPTAELFGGYIEGREAPRPPPAAYHFAAYHFMAALMKLFNSDHEAAKSIAHTILAAAIKREQDTRHPGVMRRRREIEIEEGDAVEHQYAEAEESDPFSHEDVDIDAHTAKNNVRQTDK